jgi:error-prone DNA polymerase
MDYIELHAHSYFSLLDGASSPDDLAQRAAQLSMSALALTDHDAFYGVPSFVRATRKAGIRPLIGAELTLHDKSHLTLLVRNDAGYRNLSALITAAHHNAPKGEALLPENGLEGHTDGLIALSGCRLGRIPAAVRKGEVQTALRIAKDFVQLFGEDHFWIELQHHKQRDDHSLITNLANLAKHVGVGVVATNNVHYAMPDRYVLQDVLVCIHDKTTLDEAKNLRPNSEYYLKSGQEMAELFTTYLQALQNTLRIAEQCEFELPDGLQTLPIFPTPGNLSADQYLQHLCTAQANRLELPANAYDQINHELRIITECGLSNYFLIVWDVVQYARSNAILCQGRGSAANSLVAYLLDISPVNPLAHNLVFERFLSNERQVVPDIDIDFDAARREEVIQYIYQHYGLDHAGMACTFVTFRARSAIRDIGKALGLPIDVLEHVTTTLDAYKPKDLRESASLKDALSDQIGTETWQHILNLSEQIADFPRHIGIHNGGMVITGQPISHRVPTEPARMEDRYVVQWDKEGLEDAGMVKIDILGLRMLSAIAEAVNIIGQMTGNKPDLTRLTFDDPTVYDMICKADTVGVFQVESRAQAQILPRLKPRQFADLIVSISIIRPGPVQGNMVHPYLRRRDGDEPVEYFHPLLEEVLKETLGVILYQEQCLKVAHILAGFTPGQGELLRRALGAKHALEAVDKFHQQFIDGATANGVAVETAEVVFDKLRAFGSYSFPKSHAAAFAVLVYYSAWLKCYHPIPFAIALLNNQPMGFWSPAIIVNDARRHQIAIYPVDINRSLYPCTPEKDGIRLGFNYVSGFGEDTAEHILRARRTHTFSNFEDFYRRVTLPRQKVENLIAAGALNEWGKQRDLIWRLGLQQQRDMLALPVSSEPIQLPVLSQAEKANMEYRATGLTTGPHPMTFYRRRLQQRKILDSQQLAAHPVERIVWVAGINVVHQSPPTAKGFHFITLEDEYGFMNLIVKPKLYVRLRRTIRSKSLLLAQGKIQRQGDVTNLIVVKCVALDEKTLSARP